MSDITGNELWLLGCAISRQVPPASFLPELRSLESKGLVHIYIAGTMKYSLTADGWMLVDMFSASRHRVATGGGT